MSRLQIILLGILGIILMVFVFFFGIYLFRGSLQSPGWQTPEQLIQNGDLPPPGKIFEITLTHQKGGDSEITIGNVRALNGYAAHYSIPEPNYKLVLVSGNNETLKEVPFAVPQLFSDEHEIPKGDVDTPTEKIDFIVVADWISSAATIQVKNPLGSVIAAKNIGTVPFEQPSSPQFQWETIRGDEFLKMRSQEPSSFLQDSPLAFFALEAKQKIQDALLGEEVSASPLTGTLDIVFVGDRYPDVATFQADVDFYFASLFDKEPYRSRAYQVRLIRTNAINIGLCNPNAPGFPACDLNAIETLVLNMGVPVDKIAVLLNKAGGFNGQYSFLGFSTFTSRCCLRLLNDRGTSFASIVFPHELAHLLGGLVDEYLVTATPQRNPDPNCYAGAPPNPLWTGGSNSVVGLADYAQRCFTTAWWRGAFGSIMDNGPPYLTSYFNALGQRALNQQLTNFSATPRDTAPPTASITAPANGATVSGVVGVTTTSSDTGGSFVSFLQFWIDGIHISTAYEPPFSFSFNSGSLTPGNHILQVKAIDGSGNFGALSAPITIIVGQVGNGNISIILPGQSQESEVVFLEPGPHTVTETVPFGWTTASSICNITIVRGQTSRCAFRNISTTIPPTGTVTITKTSIGGSATFNFTSNIPNRSSFTITTTPSGPTNAVTYASIPFGTYTVTESDPGVGWTTNPSSRVCTFTINAQNVGANCVFTNTFTPGQPLACQPATQTISLNTRASVSASGGNGTAYNWSAPEGTPPSGTGSSFSSTYITPGTKTITVTEANTQGSATCEIIVTDQPPPPLCPTNSGSYIFVFRGARIDSNGRQETTYPDENFADYPGSGVSVEEKGGRNPQDDSQRPKGPRWLHLTPAQIGNMAGFTGDSLDNNLGRTENNPDDLLRNLGQTQSQNTDEYGNVGLDTCALSSPPYPCTARLIGQGREHYAFAFYYTNQDGSNLQCEIHQGEVDFTDEENEEIKAGNWKFNRFYIIPTKP